MFDKRHSSSKTPGAAIALLAIALVAGTAAHGSGEPTCEEVCDDSRGYVGASAALVLPQGGTARMRRVGGAALRGGWYFSDFFAAEGEVAWLENAAGLAVQGLWHWQDADLYGRLFGYSAFDPFFTFGASGWIGHNLGQVGPKIGVGAFWHLADNFSLRADAGAVLGLDSDVAMVYSISAGIQYAF